MKAAVVISDPHSGVLLYPTQLACALSRLGVEVVALTWTSREQSDGLIGMLKDAGVHIKLTEQLRHRASIRALLNCFAIPLVDVRTSDMLICFGPLTAWQLRRSVGNGTAVICMIEAMGHDNSSWIKPRLGSALLNRYTDRVVALCHLEMLRLRKLGVREDLLAVIFNPIDVDDVLRRSGLIMRWGRAALLGRLGLPEGRQIVSCLASFQPRKRQDILLKAFAKLHAEFGKIDIVLAGEGAEERKLRSLAFQLGIGSRVHFVGKLNNDDALGLTAISDFIAHCSIAETFGYSMVEPLLFEKPLVATRVGIGWELGERDLAEIVEPNDEVGFTHGLRRVLIGGERIGRRGRLSREFVEANCAVERVASQLIAYGSPRHS